MLKTQYILIILKYIKNRKLRRNYGYISILRNYNAIYGDSKICPIYALNDLI